MAAIQDEMDRSTTAELQMRELVELDSWRRPPEPRPPDNTHQRPSAAETRLRRALEKGAPLAKLDDRIVQYLAGMLEGGEAVDDDELAEVWAPFFASTSTGGAADDGEGARATCAAVLRRLRSTGSPATEIPAATTHESLEKGPTPEVDLALPAQAPEVVRGLIMWLDKLHLLQYTNAAVDWCEAMGAANVDEVIDNWEAFSDVLRLRPLERRRVQKACHGANSGNGMRVGGAAEGVTTASTATSLQACETQSGVTRCRGSARGAAWRAHSPSSRRPSDDTFTGDRDREVQDSGASPREVKGAVEHSDVVTAGCGVDGVANGVAGTATASDWAAAANASCGARVSGAWKSGALLPLLRKASQQRSPPKRAGQKWLFGPPEDPFEILKEVGSGAMASVYKCSRRGQLYAVKTIGLTRLKMQRDYENHIERLHRETATLFRLRHAHVVQLYEVFREQDKLYLVMEYVDGGELLQEITRSGRLPEHVARYVFLQLVSGLRYIHSKGVVHRDLKPENVLVDGKASRPGLLEIKISDFGHSKFVDDGYSTALTRVGTPLYWAPEVSDSCLCSRGYDKRVDLWSLGILLHVMLVGMYPFDGMDPRNEETVQQLHSQLGDMCNAPPGSFAKMTVEAVDLLRGLVRVRPDARLPLSACARHPWVVLDNGPLSQMFLACKWLKGCHGRQTFEWSVPLPAEPRDARQLRRELLELTVKFKFPATLVRREVVVSISETASLEGPAWEQLMATLEHHFQGGCFQRPDVHSLGVPLGGLDDSDCTSEGDNANGETVLGDDMERCDPNHEADGASTDTPDAGDVADTEFSDLREDAGEATVLDASEAPATQTKAKCGRVFFWVHHHDDRLDQQSIASDKADGKKRQSFYRFLKSAFPSITGLLSFGKPATLVAEGRLSTVEKLMEEVEKFPGWWGDVKVKELDVKEIDDEQSWRVFENFQRIRTEELQALLVDLGQQKWYDLLMGPTVKKRFSHRRNSRKAVARQCSEAITATTATAA